MSNTERKQAEVQLFFDRYHLIINSTLTKDQKWLLVCLANHDSEELGCFPSQKTIKEETGIAQTQQKRAIKVLEELGVLIIHARHMHTNHYEINNVVLKSLQRVVDVASGGPRKNSYRGLPRTTTWSPADHIVASGGPQKTHPKTQLKTHPNPEGADLRSGRGEGTAKPSNYISDYMKDQELAEFFRNVESMRQAEGTLPMVPSVKPEVAAYYWVKLIKEIRELTHQLPDPWDIIKVSNSKEFEGLKCHSWGMMISKKKYCDTKELLLLRINNRKEVLKLEHPNSDDLMMRHLDEQRRDAVMSNGDNSARRPHFDPVKESELHQIWLECNN
jgi:hypothetical protein